MEICRQYGIYNNSYDSNIKSVTLFSDNNAKNTGVVEIFPNEREIPKEGNYIKGFRIQSHQEIERELFKTITIVLNGKRHFIPIAQLYSPFQRQHKIFQTFFTKKMIENINIEYPLSNLEGCQILIFNTDYKEAKFNNLNHVKGQDRYLFKLPSYQQCIVIKNRTESIMTVDLVKLLTGKEDRKGLGVEITVNDTPPVNYSPKFKIVSFDMSQIAKELTVVDYIGTERKVH
ncbi:MAG: hypothetical protein AABY22_22940, partial [Nanoarchaeota archaeon]